MQPSSLKVLAWNFNGLEPKRQELNELLRHKAADVTLVNDPHFNEFSALNIQNCTYILPQQQR